MSTVIKKTNKLPNHESNFTELRLTSTSDRKTLIKRFVSIVGLEAGQQL